MGLLFILLLMSFVFYDVIAVVVVGIAAVILWPFVVLSFFRVLILLSVPFIWVLDSLWSRVTLSHLPEGEGTEL